MTRRERIEARIAKRREWAEGRKAKSAQAFGAAHRLADGIPFGQPILVGHHSEKRARRDAERIRGAMDRGVESQRMAARHVSVAGNLQHALDRSVFSDDPDAVEALEARIAELEAKRDLMKRVNALYRKGDAAGLAELGLDLERLRARVAAVGYSWVKAPFEAYQLQNLGKRIATDRKRIDAIRAQAARAAEAEAAGGVRVERAGDWVLVTFAEKPERAVLEGLRAAGFRWGGGSWSGPADRLPAGIEARESAQEVT